MIAATMGDMTTILALLRMSGVDRRLVCAHGNDAVDYAVQYGTRVQFTSVFGGKGTLLFIFADGRGLG